MRPMGPNGTNGPDGPEVGGPSRNKYKMERFKYAFNYLLYLMGWEIFISRREYQV